MANPYSIKRDQSGHWLVTRGATERPVALFYGHNVTDSVARNRAEKFVKAMA